MTKNQYLETDFFDKFICKCGECKHTCCSNWKITFSKDEYLKLTTSKCSKELSDKIEAAFVEPDFITNEEYRKIAPNYLGYCPMLDKDGLCMIQKELGAQLLSEVCRAYPRAYKKINDKYEAMCTNSCEKVIELLMDEDSLTFVEVESDKQPNIIETTVEDSYHQQMLFTSIIKDRSIPLNERIEKICNIINDKGSIHHIDNLNAFLETANFIKIFSFKSDIYENFLNILINRYDLNNDGLKLFKQDEKQFELNYPKWMIYFENIIINHLYYMNVPFVDERIRKEDATKGLCLLYALMKIICTISTIEDHSNEHLAVVLADIFHLVEHSAFYYNANILIKDETILLFI